MQIPLAFGGTAVNGVDCTALPATVTIPAGQASVQLDVLPTTAGRNAMVKLKVSIQPGSTYQLDTTNVKSTKARVRIWPAS